MAQHILSFHLELKNLSNILKAVDKSALSLNNKLSEQMSAALKKYNEGLKELKINPIQNQNFHEGLSKLKNELQKATRAKIKLNLDEAKENLKNLKTEILSTVATGGAILLPVKTAIDFEG